MPVKERYLFSEEFHRKVLPRMADQVHQRKGKSSIVIPDSLLACLSHICGTAMELLLLEGD